MILEYAGKKKDLISHPVGLILFTSSFRADSMTWSDLQGKFRKMFL